jgi:hypothetical protein
MKLEDKVPTLEQCKKLVELEVMLETEKRWCGIRWFHATNNYEWVLTSGNLMSRNHVPAPDVAELGILLPVTFKKDKINYYFKTKHWLTGWHAGYIYEDKFFDTVNEETLVYKHAETEAQARCAALIWLIENSYIKLEELKL